MQLISFVKENPWTIYLIPFEMTGRSLRDKILATIGALKKHDCLRHDIYAVSPTFGQSAELQALLLKFDGVLHSALPLGKEIGDGDQLCGL